MVWGWSHIARLVQVGGGGAAQVMRPVQWVTLHNAFLKMWFDHA